MSKIILGVDPGIADTGYGVIKVDGSQVSCLTYGSIKTKAHEALASRLDCLYQNLGCLIEKYQPDFAAVEELFFSKNVKTALTVGQARGVILLSFKQHNLPFFELKPAQVKQAVACYGAADKKQVQQMVKLILKLERIPQPDDAADALAMALCAINYKTLGRCA
jgi:crossover junction endodeoxyribonuclease RuvC